MTEENSDADEDVTKLNRRDFMAAGAALAGTAAVSNMSEVSSAAEFSSPVDFKGAYIGPDGGKAGLGAKGWLYFTDDGTGTIYKHDGSNWVALGIGGGSSVWEDPDGDGVYSLKDGSGVDIERALITRTQEGALGGVDAGWRGRNYSGALSGTWEKLTPDNPALPAGSSGAWDNTEVEEPRVILDEDQFKMLYDGYDGATRSIGLATAPETDITNWTKDSNNPVITPADYASLDNELRLGSLIKEPDGSYLAIVADGFGSSSRGLHILSSTDLVSWTYETEVSVTVNDGVAGTPEMFRIGQWYYIVTEVGENSGNKELWAYRTKTPTGSWDLLYDGPIYLPSKDVVSTPSVVQLGSELRFHWEEYDDPEPADGSSLIYSATMPVAQFTAGSEAFTETYEQTTDIRDWSDTSYSGTEKLPKVRVRGHTTDYRAALKFKTTVSAPSGETTSVKILANGYYTGEFEASVTSNSGASAQDIDSSWTHWPQDLADDNRIFFNVKSSSTSNGHDVIYTTLHVQKVPQLNPHPASPHITTGGSSWDAGRVMEGHVHYFGGRYLYAFYEARDSDNAPSQIGVVRTPLV